MTCASIYSENDNVLRFATVAGGAVHYFKKTPKGMGTPRSIYPPIVMPSTEYAIYAAKLWVNKAKPIPAPTIH